MEKPLYVQVAEALGWWDLEQDKGCILLPGASPEWRGYEPGSPPVIGRKTIVPRFSTEWSAAGPYIERLGIGCAPSPYPTSYSIDGHRGSEIAYWPRGGYDSTHECWEWEDVGETRLIAVCNLILALHEAGKLKELLEA
jgi:hypothetical protein